MADTAPPPAVVHRSSAWPLAGVWVALIVYASWHPFTGWRLPVDDLAAHLPRLLWLPPPHHSSRFDVWSNFAGYLPLGGLLCLARLRDLQNRPHHRADVWLAVGLASLAALSLSLLMEWGQYFLPRRVPSRTDWLLNSAGGLSGAAFALLLDHLGVLRRWHVLRNQWFVPHGTLGLALLLSWPAALLFTPPLPYGLGQVGIHLSELARAAVDRTPWADATVAWLPVFDPGASLAPGAEMLAITLGALAPDFVAYCMMRRLRHRLVLLAGSLLLGVATTAMSTMLNFGPEHGLAWMTPAVPPALLLAAILGTGGAWLPRRVVAALGVLALTGLVLLVNRAGTDPFASLSLQAWEQGRFVRFHGLSQWLGWLWPYAAGLFLAMRLLDGWRPRGSRGLPTISP